MIEVVYATFVLAADAAMRAVDAMRDSLLGRLIVWTRGSL